MTTLNHLNHIWDFIFKIFYYRPFQAPAYLGILLEHATEGIDRKDVFFYQVNRFNSVELCVCIGSILLVFLQLV